MPFFRTPDSESSLHIPDQVDHESGTIVSIMGNEGHMKSTYLDEDNLRSIAAHLNNLLDRDEDDTRDRANDTTEEPDMDEDNHPVDESALKLTETDPARSGTLVIDGYYDEMGEVKISVQSTHTKPRSTIWLTKPQVYDLRRHLDAIDLEDHEPEGYDDEPRITHLCTCVDARTVYTTVALSDGRIMAISNVKGGWFELPPIPPEGIE